MALWLKGATSQRLFQSKLSQDLERIRGHVDACPDLAETRPLLKDHNLRIPAQGLSDRKTSQATADNCDAQLSAHDFRLLRFWAARDVILLRATGTGRPRIVQTAPAFPTARI